MLAKERSAGCIIIRNNKVLLIHQKNGDFWGFPKGHIEDGETEVEGALREVREETGLIVEIDENTKCTVNYIHDNIDETVTLYKATTDEEDITIQRSEVYSAGWFNINEALNLIKYENYKEALRKIIKDCC